MDENPPMNERRISEEELHAVLSREAKKRTATLLLVTVLNLLIAAVLIGSAIRGGLTLWMILLIAPPFVLVIYGMRWMLPVLLAAAISGLISTVVAFFANGLGQAAIAFALTVISFGTYLILKLYVTLRPRYAIYHWNG